MTDTILRRLVDGVGIITYNRPERHNALTDEMSALFREAVSWTTSSDDVRCILLRGEGPSFSSGRDTSELGHRTAGQSDRDYIAVAQAGKRRLFDSDKPIVAALHGYCLGGAFETALMADIRIGAEDLRVGFPEVRFGLIPDTGGTQLLTDLIGPARAKLLILSGQPVGAQEAYEWGVVDRLVTRAEIDATAVELAKSIAAQPPLAAAAAKALVDRRRRDEFGTTLELELDHQVRLFALRRS